MKIVIDSLEWEPPKEINTRGGPMQIKKASPNEQFWELWRQYKPQLQAAGFTISNFQGVWTVNWWERRGVFIYPDLPVVEEAPADGVELQPLVNESLIPEKFRFQIPLIQHIVAAMAAFNACLNGSGTGTGKTFMTLYAILERKRKLLVIGPKVTTIKWMRAAASVGVECVGSYGWEWIKTGKTPFGHWEYVNPKGKNKNRKRKKGAFIWTIPDDTDLVFDEVHRASATDSDNAAIVVCARNQALPIHLLSATIADDPIKMRATGYVLGLHRDGEDFKSWLFRNGVKEITIRVPTGKYDEKGEEIRRKIKLLKFGGESEEKKTEQRKHLLNIHRSIFPHKGVRVRAEELGEAFPETQIIAEPYLMDNVEEVNAIYKAMLQEIDFIHTNYEGKVKQANILTAVLHARMKVEMLKVPVFVSLTRDALAEGNSVFVPVNFRATMFELIKELNIKAWIAGDQEELDRQNMIDAFQDNKVDIITGIIPACREGLDLHDVHGGHPRMSIVSPPVSANNLRQVLGRVHRVGGATPSIQRIVYAANTIEEKVCKNLANKLDRLDLLMDGNLREGIFPDAYSDLRMDDETELLAVA